jgi:hypothetical protein
MAATKATANLGMANKAVSGWRASRSTTKVQQALQFTWLVSIPWLLTIAELCVPRRFSQVETTRS